MGQTLDTPRRRPPTLIAGATAPERAAGGAHRFASLLLVVALTTLVAAVLLTVWTRPGPDTLSTDARAAVRAECGDRVAAGLSPDMATCTSWATELRLDALRAAQPASPAMLVLAVATGLLAGMVVLLATGPTIADRSAPLGERAYRGSVG